MQLRAPETFALSLKISGSHMAGLPWRLAAGRRDFESKIPLWPAPLASTEARQMLWVSRLGSIPLLEGTSHSPAHLSFSDALHPPRSVCPGGALIPSLIVQA